MNFLNQIRNDIRCHGGRWTLQRYSGWAALKEYLTGVKMRCHSALHFSRRDTLLAVYDLDVSPLTYDGVWFFVGAELERRKRGLKFLEIILVSGRNDGVRVEEEAYDRVVNRGSRLWRVHSILAPCAQLMVVRPALHILSRRMAAPSYLWRAPHIYPRGYRVDKPKAFDAPEYSAVISDLNSHGLSVFFSCGATGRRYVDEWRRKVGAAPRLIVVTLRYYDYMPDRNSDIVAWQDFARSLDREKYTVVFIPDTDTAFSPPMQALENEFLVLREAAFSVQLRMAFYEAAYLNMATSSGPISLFVLNEHCRYLRFKNVVSTAPMSTEKRLQDYGLAPGRPPAFANNLQTWIWADDRPEVLAREFEKFVAQAENLGIASCPDVVSTQNLNMG